MTAEMDDFGGKLRQARERRGISLRQIASSTKIAAAALDALEKNDISKLPGGIFSRAFVRSYAVEVGLDPDDTVKEFLQRFNQDPPPSAEAMAAAIPEEEKQFEQRQGRVVEGDDDRAAYGMVAPHRLDQVRALHRGVLVVARLVRIPLSDWIDVQPGSELVDDVRARRGFVAKLSAHGKSAAGPPAARAAWADPCGC